MKWLNRAGDTNYVYLLPAIVFILIFTGGGLLYAGKESVSISGFPLSTYTDLFKMNDFWIPFVLSILIAFISTFLSVVIGLFITRTLYRLFQNDMWKYVIWVPMVIPHFIGAYLIYLFFSQGGFLSSIAFHLGSVDMPKDFPALVNDRYYIGVILSYVWKEIPFVVLMLLPVYQEINQRYEDVVRTLGGSKWTVFKTVEWPWVFPVLVETSFILFSFVLAAYEIPALLGITYPKMVSVVAYDWFYEGDWSMRPYAQAVMMIIIAFLTVTIWLIFRLTKRTRMQ